MKLLIAVTLSTVLLSGDTITFTTSKSVSALASGNLVEFSDFLTVPKFDITLGQLNEVTFRLDAMGKLYQDIITPPSFGLQDFIIDGSLVFLGTERVVHSAELVNPCSPFPNTSCTISPNINYAPGGSGIYFSMWGTLTPEESVFKEWTSLGIRPFTTAEPMLDTFLLNTPISLPVSSIARVSSNWSGILQPQQTTGWNLSGSYNYTPITAHMPEPKLLTLILILTAIGGTVKYLVVTKKGR